LVMSLNPPGGRSHPAGAGHKYATISVAVTLGPTSSILGRLGVYRR
jgi:hypothetical protein